MSELNPAYPLSGDYMTEEEEMISAQWYHSDKELAKERRENQSAQRELLARKWVRSQQPAVATSRQVGGDHYKDLAIQPTEFIQRNQLNFCEGNAIKYICRHAKKGKTQDIDKAIHYLEMLKEIEYDED